ncbi:hypothetical protein [Robertmurraya sp. FSL R5-0851]|uniref:hypothetical protein n=1 Tax=Robertmurraya sp. FSL R5-0851 TaxID=2921584 RepID=UPI0030F6B751
MLRTTVTFFDTTSFALDSPFLRRKRKDGFEIYLSKADKIIGHVLEQGNEIVIEYSSELQLEEYTILHDVITHIHIITKGTVDDSKSFLGYLSNGEPAYIMTNWESWIQHIRYSMKHCQ